MSIKVTYKGDAQTFDADHIKLDIVSGGHGAYLEDDVDIEASGGGNAQVNFAVGAGFAADGVTLDLDKTFVKYGTYGYRYSGGILIPENSKTIAGTGVKNSFAMVKIPFTLISAADITVSMAQSSEQNYDYGFLSQLDTELGQNYNTTDANGVNLGGTGGSQYGSKGKSGTFTYTFTSVPAGEHFITVKYRKDGSSDVGSDYCAITQIEASVSQIVKEKYYVADHSDTPTKFNFDIEESLNNYGVNLAGIKLTKKGAGIWTMSDWKQLVRSNLIRLGSDPASDFAPCNYIGLLTSVETPRVAESVTITANGTYHPAPGTYNDPIVVNVSGGGSDGHTISLMRWSSDDNDINIFFNINGISHRVDQSVDGASCYVYPPMSGIETISIKCDHFSSPFSPGSSWFRIRPVGGAWHNLSENEVYTLTSDCELQFGFGACLLRGTLITMADGTYKPVEDIEVGDLIMDYQHQPKSVTRCQHDTNNYKPDYDVWTFEDGTVIKTAVRHRFYNIERQKMVYLDEWEIGDRAYNERGEAVALTRHEHVGEACQHYSLWTETQNYFAGGLLAGNRHTPGIRIEVEI